MRKGRKADLKTEILFEDAAVAVCLKPAGVVSQSTAGGEDMIAILNVHFAENGEIPNDFAEISASVRIDDFNKFFHKMLDLGEYFAPSAYEAGFVSAAHSQEIIKQTIKNAEIAFKALKA